MPTSPSLLAVEGMYLMSAWKPILLLLPFLGWGWFVSAVMDKHAARFHLGRNSWNVIHLTMGMIAVLGAFLMPIEHQLGILASLGFMVVVLGADILIYAMVANKDERVPERYHIRFNLDSWRAAREEKAAEKRAGKAELTIRRPDRELVQVPDVDAPEFELRLAAERLYIRCRELRASQVDLAPGRDGAYTVSFLVDGVRQPGETIPGPDAVKIIDFWKSAAGMDLADRRRPRRADIQIDREGSRSTVRVSTIGTQAGMRLTLLVDPAESVRRKPEDLGLAEAQLKALRAITSENKGVVILSGPPDSGRTTTMYTLVKMHDAYTSNVQTIETEPQAELEGIRLNTFDPFAEGPEFSTLIRSILRRDPDVVGIAEVPDAATAKEIARSDHDRTRIYACLRADNALTAVQTYVKAVGEPQMAAESLRGVVAHRLMRRLCENCKAPYQPSAEMLKKLGLPADRVKQLFKKGGQVLIKNKPEVCPMCSGVGYFGQVGVFEVFPLGADERRLIAEGDFNGLRAALRKTQLPTIQQAALLKAVEGVTSVEEVTRITAPPARAGQQAPQAKQPEPEPAA